MTKPVNRAHLPKGPPPKQPPANAAAQIEALAADGWSIVGVAKALATSKDTLGRWFDEFPELKEAFDNGRECERHALHNKLYRAAMEDGNITAACMLLNSRHGYRTDQGEQGNRVSINFTLPGAMTMAEFKVIENGESNRVESVSAKSLTVARGS